MFFVDVELWLINCKNFCCLIYLCVKCMYIDFCLVLFILVVLFIVREKNDVLLIMFIVLFCFIFVMCLIKVFFVLLF